MGHHDALLQWHSADPQGFLGRYQLDATYRPRYGRAVVTVVSDRVGFGPGDIELKFNFNEEHSDVLL